MDFDCWCTCGRQIYDPNSLYCSKECANADNANNQSINTTNKSTIPQVPPSNLHFSITITPNIYRASDSNAKVTSTPSSISSSVSSFTSIYTLDNNFNDIYDYVFSNNSRNEELELADDECFTYYSTSATSDPIDIPKSKIVTDPSLEPNKGTFGNKTIL